MGGGAHIWKVGGKVFAVGGWEKNNNPAFTFKTSKADFFFLQDLDGFRPAPYLAARGMTWVQLYDSTKIATNEIHTCILESHRLVSLGLTKKKQKALGLNQGTDL